MNKFFYMFLAVIMLVATTYAIPDLMTEPWIPLGLVALNCAGAFVYFSWKSFQKSKAAQST